MTWADALVRFSQDQLGDRERDALYARGVTDEQIRLFRVGYVNRHLPALEGAEEFTKWSHQGARLEDMFVLPLTTITGVVKGFQFRHVDRERKGYTDYFLSQDEPAMFGLAQAVPSMWDTENVFLVEGAFDLFPIQRHVPWVFATMTAKVTVPVARVLRRFVRRVWLGYDMDARGRKASKEFVQEYRKEFETHVVSYPKVCRLGSTEPIKDPGDLWEVWGDDQIRTFLHSVLS